jgi:hypothetical protein
MHQPGYVQGGQEVGRSYLLLGIHYRRIRKHSTEPVLLVAYLHINRDGSLSPTAYLYI